MTDYEYDKNLPYVVVTGGGNVLARFHYATEAGRYAVPPRRVIDTTPKPRVPDDAKFIIWFDPNGEPHVAQYWGGKSRKWEEVGTLVALPLEDLPGVTPDTVFTVLDARDERGSDDV